MNTIAIGFYCPTEVINSPKNLEIALLSQRGIAFDIEDLGNGFSLIKFNQPAYSILECFYILKDSLILSENVQNAANGEVITRCKMEFTLKPSITSRLIGSHGVAIEALRKIAYCAITVNKVDDGNDAMSLVTLSGEPSGIPQVFNLLMMRVIAHSPKLGWPVEDQKRMESLTSKIDAESLSNSTEYSKVLMTALNPKIVKNEDSNEGIVVMSGRSKDQAKLSFNTPNKMVGSIIGEKGSTIQNIRAQTSTQVVISALEEGQDVRTVHVTGSLVNVKSATEMIIQAMERALE